MTNITELVAPCGLYCGACSIRWGGNKCQGCRVGPDFNIKCSILTCLDKKGLSYCYQCEDMPCKRLQKFEASERAVHHRGIIKEIGRIRDMGVKSWAEEQDKFWRCPDCGTPTHWYSEQCSKCGRDLSGHSPFVKR
jgi:hypothetical protein